MHWVKFPNVWRHNFEVIFLVAKLKPKLLVDSYKTHTNRLSLPTWLTQRVSYPDGLHFDTKVSLLSPKSGTLPWEWRTLSLFSWTVEIKRWASKFRHSFSLLNWKKAWRNLVAAIHSKKKRKWNKRTWLCELVSVHQFSIFIKKLKKLYHIIFMWHPSRVNQVDLIDIVCFFDWGEKVV